MPHQSNKARAAVTWFAPEKQKVQEEEYQSLEEALLGEVKPKEPEGDPSY